MKEKYKFRRRKYMALSDEQIERYSRHIILKEVGAKGQKKLLNAKVLIIGAGGHAKVIADIIEKSGDQIVGFLDDKIEKRIEVFMDVLKC